jgi:choline dehydrogenase-like flavoprotein
VFCLNKKYLFSDGQKFDYIVVGAGAEGAPAAARLALAGKNVLLVEAGGDPGRLSKVSYDHWSNVNPLTAVTSLGVKLFCP